MKGNESVAAKLEELKRQAIERFTMPWKIDLDVFKRSAKRNERVNMITFHLPESPGVYVLKWDERFIYIGMASNIRARVRQHSPTRLPRNEILFFECDESEARIIEARMIKRYQPEGNVFLK